MPLRRSSLPASTVTFLPSGDLAVGTTGTELIVLDPISLKVMSRIAVRRHRRMSTPSSRPIN